MNFRRGVFLAILTFALYAPSVTQADTANKEAGRHFSRGVALYSETDYRAALVEFKRAYDIMPNAAVLYNIGETYFQLQNYAAALITLERYLSEAGTAAPHRAEVEQTLETLQTRVGKVAITTNAADCEASVDDEPVGKTPFKDPVLVSIGRRKVSVTCERRAPEVRFVDVAAGDTVPLQLHVTEPAGRISAAGTPASSPTAPSKPAAFWWNVAIGAGAVWLVAGGAAVYESHSLSNARNTYPVTRDELSSKSTRVKWESAIGDVAGGVAAVAAGIGLYVTLTHTKTHEVRVSAMPHGVQLVGTFR
jgi:tetratricopeptide (TPR) repeat protein